MKTRWRVLFAAIVILVLIYIFRKINFFEVWQLIVEADNLYFFLAILSYGVSFLIYNIRSMYLQRNAVKANFLFNLQTVFAGFFVNVATPGAQVGGDPVRAYYLGKKYGRPKSKIFGAILADRVLHMMASMFFIILSLIFIITYVSVSHEVKAIFQLVLFFSLFLVFFLSYISFRKTDFNIELLLERIRKIFPIGKRGRKTEWEKIIIKHFGSFAKTFRKVIRNKKMILLGLGLSLIYFLLNFLVSYSLFLSFGASISFFLVIVVVSLGNLVGDFSPTPGGMGLIEGFTIIIYSLLGVNLTLAVAVSLLSRIIFYFYSIFIGGLVLVHLEKEFG